MFRLTTTSRIARPTPSALLVLGIASFVAGSGFDGTNNVALYWGQNSFGQGFGENAQQPLATYCATSNADIIPMAFLVQMTTGQGQQPVLNFANIQDGCPLFPGTQLIDCSQIGEDIKTCQQEFNKTILLSIGGATYTEGGFPSPEAAIQAANLLWATFDAAASISPDLSARDDAPLRPFGDAVIDGFDLDFESYVQNTVPFANQLRTLMDADNLKKYYMTVAPQCPYPDAAVGSMLDGGVKFDAVFVQFYNNYCGVQNFVPDSLIQNNFNFQTWDQWAKTGSANPDVKIFLGVPSGQTGAGSGYKEPAALASVIQYSMTFSSFGGVMMWDASQAHANVGFLDGVKASMSQPVVTMSQPLIPEGAARRKARRVRRSGRDGIIVCVDTVC
ncbi:glycoside hydrolase family 18 protein [Dissoconium aciculare CBS 342.82]|uniref:chitinase n=1 Tax=Dissoconium aciculare CBS 342.82 TaxID=1314786 RepID=A0A6J3MB69_9PEZI|nr:glycoside hydrolase family 18 protein [Dissoconium aciculare CBS 342.82]KAF1825103.1 glycoside hydrolase family 18 protein [Dissoconium aciculare CBS 342.82]